MYLAELIGVSSDTATGLLGDFAICLRTHHRDGFAVSYEWEYGDSDIHIIRDPATTYTKSGLPRPRKRWPKLHGFVVVGYTEPSHVRVNGPGTTYVYSTYSPIDDLATVLPRNTTRVSPRIDLPQRAIQFAALKVLAGVGAPSDLAREIVATHMAVRPPWCALLNAHCKPTHAPPWVETLDTDAVHTETVFVDHDGSRLNLGTPGTMLCTIDTAALALLDDTIPDEVGMTARDHAKIAAWMERDASKHPPRGHRLLRGCVTSCPPDWIRQMRLFPVKGVVFVDPVHLTHQHLVGLVEGFIKTVARSSPLAMTLVGTINDLLASDRMAMALIDQTTPRRDVLEYVAAMTTVVPEGSPTVNPDIKVPRCMELPQRHDTPMLHGMRWVLMATWGKYLRRLYQRRTTTQEMEDVAEEWVHRHIRANQIPSRYTEAMTQWRFNKNDIKNSEMKPCCKIPLNSDKHFRCPWKQGAKDNQGENVVSCARHLGIDPPPNPRTTRPHEMALWASQAEAVRKGNLPTSDMEDL